MHKYKAKPVKYQGKYFASRKEFAYYKKLELLKKAGEIKDFEHQRSFLLQGAYTNGKGKKIREIKIIIDFAVYDNKWNETLVDTKGVKTKDYLIKKKLFEKKYFPMVIQEK